MTPVYNVSEYLSATAEGVLSQSHEEWNWWLVDDWSTDESYELAQSIAASDRRIHVLRNESNRGAARARNLGLARCTSRYVAFLDADDVWHVDKLAAQRSHMSDSRTYFSYTGFQYMSSGGELSGAKVRPPQSMSYREALRNTTILTSTVMVDRTVVDQDLLCFPDIRRGQDTALWWRLLKTYGAATGIPEVYSYYRQTPGSLSNNKMTALKRTWHLYREVESLPLLSASWYFGHYAFNATWRRLGSRHV